jgi:ankyrin repeat protein
MLKSAPLARSNSTISILPLEDAKCSGVVPSLVCMLKLLERGADFDIQNKLGTTPLLFACDNDHMDIVQLLLARGAALTVSILSSIHAIYSGVLPFAVVTLTSAPLARSS